MCNSQCSGVKKIKAVLPYKLPGRRVDHVSVSLKLNRMTVLLGPNASGKTIALESIGYLVSSILPSKESVLGLSLTKTLRPTRVIPNVVAGFAELNTMTITILYAKLRDVLTFKAEKDVFEIIVKDAVGVEKSSLLLQELEKDFNRKEVVLFLDTISHTKRREPVIENETIYGKFTDLIESLVGDNFEISAIGLGPNEYSTEDTSREELIRKVLRRLLCSRRCVSASILYYVYNGDSCLNRALVLNDSRVTVLVRKKGHHPEGLPRLSVFHPSFIYWRGLFENLYKIYVKEGFENEEESLALLREYISWVKGYELIGKVLHLRSKDGKRIPVYELSDGQRVAVFLSLLYAISRPPVLFLLDTPEAFVHPDGLPLVAELIARYIANGNQVVVATQSIEFLEELLNKAKQYSTLSDTIVHRMEIGGQGKAYPKATWDGETALGSIDELGADLRR